MRLNRLLMVFIILLVAFSAYSADRALKMKIKMPDGKAVSMYSGSYALIIGNSNYTNGWPSLAGVKKDVQLVKTALESKGFEVTLVEDVNRDGMQRAFDQFISKHGNNVNNRLLFYFAGHGHTMKLAYGGDMGYIIPVDAPNPNYDKHQFINKSMDMQQIEVYAKRIQSKHALFMFDSCFSGSIFALSRAVPENINYKTIKPVRQFITSGGADEQVPDESIFRAQFIAGINGDADVNKDGYVTGVELGEYLQNTVVNYSKGAQHPQYGKIRNPHLDKGDFVFIGNLDDINLGSDTKTDQEKPLIPPPPPVAVAGHLQVNVNVADAKVYLDGEFIGNASFDKPLNHSNLPTGEYIVKVVADGTTQQKTADIKLNQWDQMIFTFEKKKTLPPVEKKTYTTDEPTNYVFSEYFNNNSNKWVTQKYDLVNYWISDSEYHIDRNAENKKSHCTWIYKDIDDSQDFVIETKLRKVGGKDNWGYGLYFGGKDVDNAYRFEIAANGYYTIGDMKGGNWSNIVNWKLNPSINKYNASNTLKVAKKGGSFYFYINGQQVDSTYARVFKGNAIGFCATDRLHIAADYIVAKGTAGGSKKTTTENKTDTKKSYDFKVVMDETFNNNTNGWTVDSDSKRSYSIRGGQYHIDKHAKENAHCTWVNKYINPDTGYSIVSNIEKISGVDNWGFGVMFGANRAVNSYRFEISGNGQYIFGKVVNDKWITLVPWTKSDLIKQGNGAKNKLRIGKTGDYLFLYVNDKLLKQVKYEPHMGNDIGFCVDEQIHIAVDDIILRQY